MAWLALSLALNLNSSAMAHGFWQTELSLSDCQRSVEDFEQLFWGLEVELTETTAQDPDSLPSNHKGPRLTNQWFRVAHGPNGRFVRKAWEFTSDYRPKGTSVGTMVHIDQQETCYLNDQWIDVWRREVDGKESESGASILGRFDLKTTPLAETRGAICLWFGISDRDGKRLSTLLARPNMQFAIEKGAHGDEEVTVFVATSAAHGEYRFWISDGDDRLIRKISIDKTVGQDYAVDDREMRVLGQRNDNDPYYRDQVSSTLTFEQFEAYGGRMLPRKLKYLVKEAAGDLKVDFEREYQVTAISDFNIDDNNKAEFEFLDVEEGLPVTVKGQEGVAYEFRDGRIVRKLDSEAIGVIDGVRFRKPKSNWLPYALPAVLFAFIGGLVWLRSRRGE